MRNRLLFCCLFSCIQWCTFAQESVYSISGAEDHLSQQWVDYLYSHLYKRSFDKSRVVKSENLIATRDYKAIYLEMVPTLEYDYCFSNKEGVLTLRVKNKPAMLFVIYQLMASIGETDHNFSTADLPPSFIHFEDQCRRFDYEYREPHLEPNTNPEYAGVLGTNNLDEDWGLWGHNLHKVVDENPEIYAQIDGAINKQQYCFSSKVLYTQLKQYIKEQFGDGTKKSYWFMVSPDDNDLVCLCDQCSKLGNTDQSATPAIGYLLNKLADEYPEHHFFSLAYRTTREAPKNTWATNTGVFFTAIDLPKGINLEGHPKFYKWEKELKNWKERVSQIYLWDYISNFDDYLSPLPVLKGFQQQLSSYKSVGVKGLFLNGSGYDYSPFDDVKTYVLSALMINKDVDVDVLVRRYLEKFYPKSSTLLVDYYLQLEDRKMAHNRPWPLYGSFGKIVKTYFNIEQFVSFYNALKVMVTQTSGEEQLRLDKLITALSFTRLQIAYHQGLEGYGGFEKISGHVQVNLEVKEAIERLKRHGRFSDMANYREVHGSLLAYLEQWEDLAQHGIESNLLSQGGISFLTAPDEDYQDASILHNGLNGFFQDYHQGWVINGGDIWELAVKLPTQGQGNVLEMRFLNLPQHKILSPDKVEITDGSQVLYTLAPTKISETIYRIRTAVDFSEITKAVQVRIFKNKQEHTSTIALDEVRLIK